MCTIITSCGPSSAAETATIQKQLVGTWVWDRDTLCYWYIFTPDFGFCEIMSLPDGSGSRELRRGTYKIGAKNIKLISDNGNTKLPYDFNKHTSILMSLSFYKKVSSDYDLY